MKNKHEENVEDGFEDYDMITSEMTLKNCPLGSGHIVLKICSQLSTNQRRQKFTNNPDKGEINYASSFIASQWPDFHHSVSSLPWVWF